MKISEALALYAERRGRKVKARATLGYAGARLLEFWGDQMVADIDEEAVESYRRFRMTGGGGRRPVRESTADRELVVLRAAILALHQMGKLTRLPGFPPLGGHPGRSFALTEEQVDRLLAAADDAAPHLRLFVYLAAFTAGRAAALLELTWDQVTLGEKPVVELNPAGRRQTAKTRATVPATKRLAAALAAARATAEAAGALDLPVIHWRGHGVRSVRKGFRALALAAGFQVAGKSKLTPHVLRHTAATLMAARGAPLAQIAGFLGQSVQRTTERYIHWTPGYLDQARAALDRESLRPAAAGGLALVG